MKKAVNKKNRVGLSSVLAQHHRKSKIFVCTAANTFGLIAWDGQDNNDIDSSTETDATNVQLTMVQ